MAVRRRRGNAECLAGLVYSHAGKVAEFDYPRGRRILGGQAGQGVIDGKELIGRHLRGQVEGVDIQPLELAAALFTALLPGAVDEDATHGLGRSREEVA